VAEERGIPSAQVEGFTRGSQTKMTVLNPVDRRVVDVCVALPSSGVEMFFQDYPYVT
jgi:hypothetical protein